MYLYCEIYNLQQKKGEKINMFERYLQLCPHFMELLEKYEIVHKSTLKLK